MSTSFLMVCPPRRTHIACMPLLQKNINGMVACENTQQMHFCIGFVSNAQFGLVLNADSGKSCARSMDENNNLESPRKSDCYVYPRSQLMAMLNDEDHVGIISWLPHGRGFMICKKKLFEKDVMPKFFSKHSKYTSFTRKLNRWGFVRVTRGPEMGAYYNKLFHRDNSILCLQMTCNRPNGMGLGQEFALSHARPASHIQQLCLSQAAQIQIQIQRAQYFQHNQLQSIGYGMEGLPSQPNYLELQQMHLVLSHRDQMLQRESLSREKVQHIQGRPSSNTRPLEMPHRLQLDGSGPPELYQYHPFIESGNDGNRTIMEPIVPVDVSPQHLVSRDYQMMMPRYEKQQQYGGTPPLAQTDMRGSQSKDGNSRVP
jgi:hypothetical protein